MAGPLEGIRILDFTTITAGAEATGFLCDLGAEVIKVEPPTGEVGRRLTVVQPGVSTFFLPQNRGKKSIVLDVKKPEGREVALRLARMCDAFAHNFRPGVMERLGLGYDDVRKVSPGIVYAEGSAFGSKGPHADHGAVDIIAQARGGLMAVTGDARPTPAGAILGDYIAAMHLAIGLLGALLHRVETGEGQKVEGSMLGSMISAQGWEFSHYLITGRKPSPGGPGHQLFRGSTWGVYETADGYLALSSVAPAKLRQVADVVDCPELKEDRFTSPGRRGQNAEELMGLLRTALAKKNTAELWEGLTALDVHCSPVQDYEQLAEDPQVKANEYVAEVEHPRLGRIRMAGNPLKFSQTPLELAASAPELGQDTDAVLRWAGYADDEIADLRSKQVI